MGKGRLAAVAYYILSRVLIRLHGQQSALAVAIGGDFKGQLSVGLYLAAIALAFLSALLSLCVLIAVALMWLVPDTRIEKVLNAAEEP